MGEVVLKKDSQINLVKRRYHRALDTQICAGDEIEFRTANDPDGLDGIALRIEDILGTKV